MKKYSLICALCSIFMLSAQEISMNLLENMAPRNIGPGGMSGRVTSIDAVHANPDIMYVGTASGGLWKSTSGGIKWEPIFDKELTASIGSIAIQQSNPSVLWVGTGEGNPRNSLNGGFGIYKSMDAGKTWKSMGLENTRHIHRVIIHPTNPNVVYVAAIGSPWGEHSDRGVYKTTDGGKTWNNILFKNDKTGAADLIMDPTNPNKLIATMWEHKRDPWFFKSGGEGSGLYITYDGGENWTKKTSQDGLPKGELGRIGVAIAPSKPTVIYALIESEKNALYRSVNGGDSWKKINDDMNQIGNRPFYYGEIHVDSENENRLFSVFTYINVSEDGGNTFSQLMPAYGVSNGVHPDHHAWWIHPENSLFMMDGNDGGMNITKDGGKTWRFIGNIPVAQFYHINVDNDFPYNVYGGMQDNGSWRGPAYVWRAQGIRNSYWQEISFGDGFDVIPDKNNSRFGWTMSQQGSVSRYDWETGNNYSVQPTHPNPDITLRFNWNAAINTDPFESSTVYFGSQFVHKSLDKGETWSIISPDLTTNNPEKQKQSESGGLTMDATGAENHTTILVIEPSPIEKNMIWVGTDDGRVHTTQDGGQTWLDVSKNLKGLPEGSWIPQIKASNKNKGEALLIANDYRRFNYTPYAYRTKNYGKSWTRIVDEKDVQSYTLSIIEDIEEPNLMFLGTDDGLYLSIDAGENWKKWTQGFPTVSVKDMVIHPREHDLIIGTFGRAAWVLDDIRPLRAIANSSTILNKKLHLFDPPTAYLAAYQQATGSRFGADAMFNGTNRKRGAQLSYFINTKSKSAKASVNEKGVNKIEWDSIYMDIFLDKTLIRSLKKKSPKKTGVYKWIWGMNEKGVDRPSRKLRSSRIEPRGITVKPGVYKVVMRYGNQHSETSITVNDDPRIKRELDNVTEVFETLKSLENLQQLAADAVKQLVESQSTAKKYSKVLAQLDETKNKIHIETSKNISDKIEQLIALYLGTVDERQGITRNPEMTVMRRLGKARRYVGSRQNGITSTETTLINHAENDLKRALEKTNTFFQKEWTPYKKDIEGLNITFFKNTEIIKIN